MECRYGKVYVLDRETTSSDIANRRPSALKSVIFSNIDHKWYDTKGRLSPLYDRYKGKSYAVQFKIQHEENGREEIEIEGKLNMPFKLDQCPLIDFESVPKIMENETKWLKSLGILSKDVEIDDGHRFVKNLQGVAAVACFCPGWKICEMKSMLASVHPFFLLDDYWDQSSSQTAMSFKFQQSLATAFLQVMKGKQIGGENESIHSSKIPTKYMNLLKSVEKLGKILLEKEAFAGPLLQSFKEFLDAMALENCMEWKAKEDDSTSLMFRTVQQDLRLTTCGAILTLEFRLFDQELKVDDKIRESFLYKSLLKAYSQQVSMVNDLMSLKKEMVDGASCNSTYLFHVKDGLSLKDAYFKSISQINLMTQIVEENGQLFIDLYGEYEEVPQIVDMVKGIMHGNMVWYAVNKRYHPNMVYDCVIEIESYNS